jgi:hypothetical protein
MLAFLGKLSNRSSGEHMPFMAYRTHRACCEVGSGFRPFLRRFSDANAHGNGAYTGGAPKSFSFLGRGVAAHQTKLLPLAAKQVIRASNDDV